MLTIRNRPARIFLRVLLYFTAIVLVLFAAISIYVETNKKQILEKLRDGMSKNLRSEITYTDADITIWRNFPFIAVHFYNINVQDSVYHMPFFRMKEVSGQVSLMQYFRKNIELRNLYFNEGILHVFTDTSGYTNKYLMQYRKEGAVQEKKKVSLNKATLKNVRVILENRKRRKLFDFVFKDLKASISEDGDNLNIDLKNKAFVRSMAFDQLKGSYMKGQTIEMNIDLRINTKKATISFDEEKFVVNGQPYLMKGSFYVRDSGFFSLSIKTKDAPYSKLQILVPNNISSKLKTINIEKPMALEATITGPLAYKTVPKVWANWTVKNNVLVTPVAKFTNASFTGSFNNEKAKQKGFTDENSEIILNEFNGNWEGIALTGKNISINNLVDPYINFSLASSTDFKTLNDKLGLRTIEFVEGKASLNLSYAGPVITDITILDKLQGRLSFTNGTIRYIPRGFVFKNCSGNAFFSDNAIEVRNLQCDLGKNHFVVNVTGTNMSGLSANDASKASIQCSVFTPDLNIGDMKGLFSRKKAVATGGKKPQKLINTAAKVDDIMDHGNLSVSLSSNTVRYNDFTGQNLKGNITFANDNLYIKNVSLAHANGRLDLNADIKQEANANISSAKVNLQNVDVKKLFHAFDNFGQDGILSQNIQGTLNALTNIALAFDNSGNVVPGSIKGTVDFSLKNGALINYEPIQDIKNFILKKRDMSHVTFAELKNKFELNGYKVKINRMEIQSSAIAMFVEGLYDMKKVDSKIDIQVPLSGLKKRDSTFVPTNIGVDAKAGASIYLQGKNDKATGRVKFGLNTTKTIRKLF